MEADKIKAEAEAKVVEYINDLLCNTWENKDFVTVYVKKLNEFREKFGVLNLSDISDAERRFEYCFLKEVISRIERILINNFMFENGYKLVITKECLTEYVKM